MVEEYVGFYLENLLHEGVLDVREDLSQLSEELKENQAFLGKIERLTNIKLGNLDVKNVAITYNNKIVELLNLYKKKNLDFVDSDVIPVIQRYFCALLEEVVAHVIVIDRVILLMKLIYKREIFHSKAKKELSDRLILLKNSLERINLIDDDIFDFEIEKHFSELLESEKDYLLIKEKLLNPNEEYQDAIMHNIEIELGLLGYNNIKGEKYPLLTFEKKFVYGKKVDIFVSEKEKQIKVRYAAYPYICSALENHLDDYVNCIVDLFKDTDTFRIEQAYAKLEHFNENEEIVDALGKYIALYELEWDLDAIKNELVSLGLASKYEELFEKINLGYYKYYPEYCNNKDSDNALKLYEQLIENKNVVSKEKTIEKSNN